MVAEAFKPIADREAKAQADARLRSKNGSLFFRQFGPTCLILVGLGWSGIRLGTLILQIYLLQSQLSMANDARELEEFAMLHLLWILLESFGQSAKIFGHLCSSM